MKIKSQQKNFLVVSAVIVPLILAIIFVGIYFNLSGTFRDAPKVEIQPKNTFNKTLHVVTDKDYAPYSFIDENGAPQGYDVELINEIANRLQMNLDLTLLDWNDANKTFSDGADIIMNMESDLIINNPEMIATLPTTEKQYVVYGRREITSVAELYGRRVASLHNMPGLGLDDEISYVKSYRKIFDGLKSGEYEFAICPIQVGNNFVEESGLSKDVFPSYAVQHVYGTLAMHPEDTQLRVKINAVLIQMQQEGRFVELDRKWILDRYENITPEEMIMSRPWLLSMILASVIFVILLTVYTAMQVRHTRAQEEYTKKLQENYETIKLQGEELKKQQRELILAKERAEESNKAKSTFLSNMSHDIRTPMNAIVGYLNLAKDLHKICEKCPLNAKEPCKNDVPNRMYGFLKKIDASSQHLLALINDVLEMSRIESGKMELELAEVNLTSTLNEIHDMFATQMAGKKINFTVTTDIREKFVFCDAHRLNRVLLNLLSNAYKFTPDGGKISVKLNQIGENHDGFADYELRVKDSGIGMTPEFAAKVFEAFERERTSTVSKIQGTGLGMAITKSIVDLMNGKIRVETAPNVGTEFIIEISFKIAEEMREAAVKTEKSAQIIDFTGKKLLLVDDIEVNREIAKMLLESEGFVVETAFDGKNAFEIVANSKPGDFDAILMDIQMPVMNGYESAKKIRALSDPRLANIPIIAMTANAFSEDVKAALEAGMDAHIAKPIDVTNMIETLAKILPA